MSNVEVIGFSIDNQQIETVSEYKYHGQIVSFEKRQGKELSAGIASGRRNFWTHKHIFKSNLNVSLKSKVFRPCIEPTLTY